MKNLVWSVLPKPRTLGVDEDLEVRHVVFTPLAYIKDDFPTGLYKYKFSPNLTLVKI